MKAGFVSFLGRPNAGKSTLLNRIVGQKLAIVSDKPQTTRTRVVGVKNYDAGQVVFVDTPGVHKPTHRMNVRMVDIALEAMRDVDLVTLVLDVSVKPGKGDRFLLDLLRDVKARGGRIVWVAGPVIVHTGAGPDFSRLVRAGFVDALLSGNALAVHDVEQALYGTSLGVSYETGIPVEEGHKNHMRAINAVNRAGSIAEAVRTGVVERGVMAEIVRSNVPFVLAGSIRDDGPLPDTLMDLVEAQAQYAEQLAGAEVVVMLSSMLHSIGVGNMLPAWVKTICVDINPAVVTKLADRGSSQAIGIVTDVGLFVHLLAKAVDDSE